MSSVVRNVVAGVLEQLTENTALPDLA